MTKRRIKSGPLMAPLPVVLVTVSDGEKSNVFTAAWSGIVNTRPPMISLSVRPERYSHAMIEKTGSFVINLVNTELVKAADYCGVRSGRNEDKFETLGLEAEPADEVPAPLLTASPLALECRVTEKKSLPTHDLYLAEVTSVHIEEQYVREDGYYDFAAMGLVAYVHGGYYPVGGEAFGGFGFSVMKPKTRKRREKEKKQAEHRAMRAERKKRTGRPKKNPSSKSKKRGQA